MSKEDVIELEGVVVKVKPNTRFDVKINDNGMIIDCTISGRLRQHKIAILLNDKVTVEISPYDLKRGRIVWRSK